MVSVSCPGTAQLNSPCSTPHRLPCSHVTVCLLHPSACLIAHPDLSLLSAAVVFLLWLCTAGCCFAAHMFDKTSVIMLCMMTVAFLIPCVLSYVPALRMLHGSGALHPSPRHTSSYDIRSAVGSNAASGAGWPGYSSSGTYTGAIPPRPHARVRPGTNPAC